MNSAKETNMMVLYIFFNVQKSFFKFLLRQKLVFTELLWGTGQVYPDIIGFILLFGQFSVQKR